MKNQIKLGLFVALGILAIAISIVAVGNFSLRPTYNVYVVFDNASGLTAKAKVKIAGVDIGILKGVALKNSKAQMQLKINKGVDIYQNATASIVSMGIIGTKYIEIYPGDARFEKVEDEGTIVAKEATSIGDLIEKISKSFSSDKTTDMIENLAETVATLKHVVRNIDAQNANISNSIANFSKFSSQLAQITAENREDIRVVVENIKIVTQKLDALITQIDKGDGTLGALLNDKQMSENLKETVASAKDTMKSLQDVLGSANKLQIQWEYMGYYNSEEQKYKNDLGIRIMPNEHKFYYLGISNLGDKNLAEDEGESQQVIDELNTIDALMGFRFTNFEVYGGIMKTKGGVGFGYSFFQPIYAPYKALQVHVNAFDFGRKEHGTKVEAGIKAGLTKWLYMGVMVEDIAYKPAVTPYLKLEINDEDIAKILGIAGVAAVAAK